MSERMRAVLQRLVQAVECEYDGDEGPGRHSPNVHRALRQAHRVLGEQAAPAPRAETPTPTTEDLYP